MPFIYFFKVFFSFMNIYIYIHTKMSLRENNLQKTTKMFYFAAKCIILLLKGDLCYHN